jgi:hypothetical protein
MELLGAGVRRRLLVIFCLTNMMATLVGVLALWSIAFITIPTCALIWLVIVLGLELGIRSSWGWAVGFLIVLQESGKVGGKIELIREKGDEEGRGYRVWYRVGEILSFVYFVWFIALWRKYR